MYRNGYSMAIQGLFSQTIRGAEIGHFGLISENFDLSRGTTPSYIYPLS